MNTSLFFSQARIRNAIGSMQSLPWRAFVESGRISPFAFGPWKATDVWGVKNAETKGSSTLFIKALFFFTFSCYDT